MSRSYSQANASVRLIVALALTAAADYLLFDQPLGLSLLLFGVLLAAAIVGVHPAAFGDRALIAKAAVAIVGLLPLI